MNLPVGPSLFASGSVDTRARKRSCPLEDETGQYVQHKNPRLVDSEVNTEEQQQEEEWDVVPGDVILNPFEDSSSGDSDVLVKCGEFTWACHSDVLSEQCDFFKACCRGGFRESQTKEIVLDDDMPLAVQAMLRYLYTGDCKQIYKKTDPIFTDVERDLDVFVIADKYNLDDLRHYMQTQLLMFYTTDKRPTYDPKGWSAKNQYGFGEVLRKLSGMEMVAVKPIVRAVAGFMVRRGGMVLEWDAVQEVFEDGDARLPNEMLRAALIGRRDAERRQWELEFELGELKEELEEVRDERDDWEGQYENLAMGTDMEEVDDFEEWKFPEEWARGGDGYGYLRLPQYRSIDSGVLVEDVLSGVSYVYGTEGPMAVEEVEGDLARIEEFYSRMSEEV